jgi:putative N6-adenine-specific DNA methylase
MNQYELIATSTFGIEAVVKRELIALGYKIVSTENGKVTFLSDEAGIARANLWLRSADRVLLKIGEFKATTFDELFDKTTALDWAKYIPKDGKFDVNGKSVKSKLFSISDCQAIVKKSIVGSLKKEYKIDWFPESGANYDVLISILKDVATLTIDTSGAGLHKRGYRIKNVEAPVKETLAAAMILLSYYSKDRVLYDVFCGSGTIPIEAALIARNIAPGISRDFASKHWDFIGNDIWKTETKKAYLAIDYDADIKIYASDISEKNLAAAIENAEEAGVDDCIEFKVSDFNDLILENNHGIVISNPPYGERLSDDNEVKKMYRKLGNKFNSLDTWSKYYLTSFSEFEIYYNKKADRDRRLYNGRLEVKYYQYYGPRPPLKD